VRQHAAQAEADVAGQADGDARAALRAALTEDTATEAMRSGALGAGLALDPSTRAAMEAAFQHPFDDVRIHTGSDAAQMASGLSARAFTVGNQIAFGGGEYAPGTGAGDALLAHELAHVVQQRHATSTGRGDSGALDADADRAAASALSALHGGEMSARETAAPSLRSGVGLQRCGGGGGAAAGALTFTSASHSPGAGGALSATPGGAGLNVKSSAYSTSGEVQASGGTDADAAAWDVGWLQTARISSRVGHYLGSPAKTKWTDSCPPNTRDGNPAGVAPWYDSANPSAKKSFTKTNTSLTVSLWDQPGSQFPWDTPDGLGKLDHTSGKDQFSSWIVVRKRAAPNTIQYINWENWEVDFSTTTNYASKGAKTVAGITGATTNAGSGAGKGGNNPTLGGSVCNDVSTQVWS